MLFKCTMLFEEGKHGWSESWYNDQTDGNLAMEKLQEVAITRREMLSTACYMVGLRVSLVDSPRTAYPLTLEMGSGTALADPDYASATIVCGMSTGELYRRVMYVRGFPDEYVIRLRADPGTFFISAIVPTWLARYVSKLQQLGFKYKVTKKSGLLAAGFRITNFFFEGERVKITTEGGAYVPGQKIKIKGVASTYKSEVKKFNKTWLVKAAVDTDIVLNAPVASFPHYADFTGGKAYPSTPDYVIPDAGVVVRPGERRAGRAFFVPPGRRSRKR